MAVAAGLVAAAGLAAEPEREAQAREPVAVARAGAVRQAEVRESGRAVASVPVATVAGLEQAAVVLRQVVAVRETVAAWLQCPATAEGRPDRLLASTDLRHRAPAG